MSWSQWRGEFAKACDGTHHTIESIERSIVEGRSHLLFGDGCCLIAEIHDYPKERACQLTWAAGSIEALKRASPYVDLWALSQGCTEILIEGHAGWARALRDVGYRPWSVTVRKALHNGTIQ